MKILLKRLKNFIRKSLSSEFIVDGKFFRTFGRHIDFNNPKTFNEKLQIIKLYGRDPRMPKLADKYEARQYVKAKGHGAILNQVIGAYDQPSEIDFSVLPDEFVIKCNHSWNTNIVCQDKSLINGQAVVEKLNEWMSHNHYHRSREWSYKNIKPKVFVERFLHAPLKDYKFYCFSGSPLYIQVDSDRSNEHTLDLYDLDWQRLDCKKGDNKQSNFPESRPGFFKDMLTIATDLSSNFHFCRVDFLANPEGFYFAEMTFYPGGGFSRFNPGEFDYIFGEHLDVADIQIPSRSRFIIKVINFMSKLNIKPVV